MTSSRAGRITRLTIILDGHGGILQCSTGVTDLRPILPFGEHLGGMPQGLAGLALRKQSSGLLQPLFGGASPDPDLFQGPVDPVKHITGHRTVGGHGDS